MDEQRNRKIYEARKEGKSYPELASLFDLSKERISQICNQEAFRESEPDLARKCAGLNFSHAAWLWARGFKIIPPDKPVLPPA